MTIVYDFADIAARMNHKPVRTEPVCVEPGPAIGGFKFLREHFDYTVVDDHVLLVTSKEMPTGVPTP